MNMTLDILWSITTISIIYFILVVGERLSDDRKLRVHLLTGMFSILIFIFLLSLSIVLIWAFARIIK